MNKIVKLIEENTELANLMEAKGDELMESLSTSMTTRSREAKINAAVGAISVSLAKKRNDPEYQKLIKYRTLWKETKNKIVNRYGSLAYQQWSSKK